MLPNVNMIPPITNIPNIGLSVKLKYSTIVTIINIPTISNVADKISIFDIKKKRGSKKCSLSLWLLLFFSRQELHKRRL